MLDQKLGFGPSDPVITTFVGFEPIGPSLHRKAKISLHRKNKCLFPFSFTSLKKKKKNYSKVEGKALL